MHWSENNTFGGYEGFMAFGAGIYHEQGPSSPRYWYLKETATFWTRSPVPDYVNAAFGIEIHSYDGDAHKYPEAYTEGYSVRCIKDN